MGDSQLVRVDESDQWRLIDERTNEARASYAWDDLRLSVSWKAYCFPDEATRDAWRQHTDDLDVEQVLQALIDDLRSRTLSAPRSPSVTAGSASCSSTPTSASPPLPLTEGQTKTSSAKSAGLDDDPVVCASEPHEDPSRTLWTPSFEGVVDAVAEGVEQLSV